MESYIKPPSLSSFEQNYKNKIEKWTVWKRWEKLNERERERERDGLNVCLSSPQRFSIRSSSHSRRRFEYDVDLRLCAWVWVQECVCSCVHIWERERERDEVRNGLSSVWRKWIFLHNSSSTLLLLLQVGSNQELDCQLCGEKSALLL